MTWLRDVEQHDAHPDLDHDEDVEQRLADSLHAHRPRASEARRASGRARAATSRSGVGHVRGAEEARGCRPRRRRGWPSAAGRRWSGRRYRARGAARGRSPTRAGRRGSGTSSRLRPPGISRPKRVAAMPAVAGIAYRARPRSERAGPMTRTATMPPSTSWPATATASQSGWANQPAAATSACATASTTAAGRSMRRRIARRWRSAKIRLITRAARAARPPCVSPAAARARARRDARGRPRSAAGRAPRCDARRRPASAGRRRDRPPAPASRRGRAAGCR